MNNYVANAVAVGLVQNRRRPYAQRHHDISLLGVFGDIAGSSKALRFEGTDRLLNSLLSGPTNHNQGHPVFVPEAGGRLRCHF